MYGWDQRTALIRRDAAMARVAALTDTASLVCQTVKRAEIERYECAKSALIREWKILQVVSQINIWLSRSKEEIDRQNHAIDFLHSQKNIALARLSVDFCQRMLAIEAIWDPKDDQQTAKWFKDDQQTAECHEDETENTAECDIQCWRILYPTYEQNKYSMLDID